MTVPQTRTRPPMTPPTMAPVLGEELGEEDSWDSSIDVVVAASVLASGLVAAAPVSEAEDPEEGFVDVVSCPVVVLDSSEVVVAVVFVVAVMDPAMLYLNVPAVVPQ